LQFPKDKHYVMYAELSNGKYAKTYMMNEQIKIDYIDRQEYASALSLYILRTD